MNKGSEVDLKPVYNVEYTTKADVELAVRECVDGILISCSEDLRRDRDVVMRVFDWNGSDFEYIASALRDDKDIALKALKTADYPKQVLNFISDRLKNDASFFKDIIKLKDKACEDYDNEISFAGEDVKNDETLALYVVKIYPNAIKDFSDNIKKSERVGLILINNGPDSNFAMLDNTLKTNKKFLVKAVTTNKQIYKVLDDSLKTDIDIVHAYLKNNIEGLAKIPESIKKDKDFMLYYAKQSPEALPYCDEEIKTVDFYLEAIKADYNAMEYVPLTLRMKKEFVIEAVKVNSKVIEFVNKRFQEDEDIKRYL